MSTQGRLLAGRYRLTDRIGAGGMGVVWKATDETLRRTVAIKQLIVQPAGGDDEAIEQSKSRAMREGRIAARLTHPNAVTVFDVVDEDETPWLVMEFVPSTNLGTELSRRGQLPPKEVARIGASVASALAAAHDAGIVHRDIKPGNVLLAENGDVKITDFGISRAVGDVVVTATGLVSGTPAYLAPEVAKGEMPNPATDVFSLGATLYAALEGGPPFGNAENPLAQLYAVAAGKITPPRVTGPVTDELLRLLSVDPAARPSMREVSSKLANAAGRTAQSAIPTMPAPALPPVTPSIGIPPHPTPPRIDTRRTEEVRAPAGPPSPPPRPVPRPTPMPAARPRRRLPAGAFLAAGAVLVIVAVVAVLVVNNFVRHRDNVAKSGLTTPVVSESSENSPPTGDSGAPTSAEMRSLLNTYYGMLPGDPRGAYALVTGPLRDKGLASFESFYATLSSVNIRNIQSAGADRVTAVLDFTTKAGVITHEAYRFRMVRSDGKLLIYDALRLGSAAAP
jgi:hypothetical protein